MDVLGNWLQRLLTPKELATLQKRFQLVKFLRSKLTYREIARKMGISTTTVVRLNQRLKIRTRRKSRLKSGQAGGRAKLPWVIGN